MTTDMTTWRDKALHCLETGNWDEALDYCERLLDEPSVPSEQEILLSIWCHCLEQISDRERLRKSIRQMVGDKHKRFVLERFGHLESQLLFRLPEAGLYEEFWTRANRKTEEAIVFSPNNFSLPAEQIRSLSRIPLWFEQPLIGQHLLINQSPLCLSGCGDVFLLWRYLRRLEGSDNTKISVLVSESIKPLAQQLPQEIIGWEELPDRFLEFDLRLGLVVLPAYFDGEIPQPPYIDPDPALVEKWGKVIGNYPGLRVGLNWRASTPYRSTTPEQFGRLLDVEGISFFSLLVHPQAEEDIGILKSMGEVTDLSPYLTDWAETAAAIANLDLVISVDTGVANLCGAMGRSDWVLYPARIPEFRWCGDWYPQIRMFLRGPGKNQGWEQILGDVRSALVEWRDDPGPELLQRESGGFVMDRHALTTDLVTWRDKALDCLESGNWNEALDLCEQVLVRPEIEGKELWWKFWSFVLSSLTDKDRVIRSIRYLLNDEDRKNILRGLGLEEILLTWLPIGGHYQEFWAGVHRRNEEVIASCPQVEYRSDVPIKGIESLSRIPVWLDQPVTGKHVLIYPPVQCLPGHGDIFLLWRYLKKLGRGPDDRVTVLLPGSMKRLAQQLPQDVVTWEELPDRVQNFDLRLGLDILPAYLGEPIPQPPYIDPAPGLVEKWNRSIGGYPGLKVGLNWRASTPDRSTTPENFGRLLDVPGITFFSLLAHHPQAEADIQVLSEMGEVIDLAPFFIDWSETAAAIANLDLVISVDTAVANLAGAMGRSDWVLCPNRIPEFRWCGGWYPQVRVFSCPIVDDCSDEEAWEQILADVRSALVKWKDEQSLARKTLVGV